MNLEYKIKNITHIFKLFNIYIDDIEYEIKYLENKLRKFIRINELM